MRRLLVTVGVFVAFLLLYLVLDVVAKGFVEGRVEEEFVNGDRVDVEDASFVIDSFPFLGRLGAYGEVSATLELEGVRERGVTVDQFRLEVDGLVFDRVSAFNGQVEVTDIDEATTSISLSESTIAELVGVSGGHRRRRHGHGGWRHGAGHHRPATTSCSRAAAPDRWSCRCASDASCPAPRPSRSPTSSSP